MFDPAAVEISRQDAPGIVPIRAFAYGLADAKFTIHEKLARLQQEMARRALRKVHAFQKQMISSVCMIRIHPLFFLSP